MIAEFISVFPDKYSCVIEIMDKHRFAYDDETLKYGIFVSADELYHVHIENKTIENYHFVQNDNCLMINEKGGQCDFVIFNSNKIHFIEIKGTDKNKANHRKKIYNQLENTFKYYKEFLEKFEFKIALACFESLNKRGYTKRKIPQSSNSEKKILFKNKYDINLFEGNYVKFD